MLVGHMLDYVLLNQLFLIFFIFFLSTTLVLLCWVSNPCRDPNKIKKCLSLKCGSILRLYSLYSKDCEWLLNSFKNCWVLQMYGMAACFYDLLICFFSNLHVILGFSLSNSICTLVTSNSEFLRSCVIFELGFFFFSWL